MGLGDYVHQQKEPPETVWCSIPFIVKQAFAEKGEAEDVSWRSSHPAVTLCFTRRHVYISGPWNHVVGHVQHTWLAGMPQVAGWPCCNLTSQSCLPRKTQHRSSKDRGEKHQSHLHDQGTGQVEVSVSQHHCEGFPGEPCVLCAYDIPHGPGRQRSKGDLSK